MTSSTAGMRRTPRVALFITVSGIATVGWTHISAATIDPDRLVEEARAGFDAFLAEIELPEPDDGPDELETCPIIPPELIQQAAEAAGFTEAFSDLEVRLEVDRIEQGDSSVDYPALGCQAGVPSELRSAPAVTIGAVRLPDDVTFEDTLESEGAGLPLDISEPSPETFGGRVITLCLPASSCYAVWESDGLLVLLGVNQEAIELGGEPDLRRGLDLVLEPVLENLAGLATAGAPTTT